MDIRSKSDGSETNWTRGPMSDRSGWGQDSYSKRFAYGFNSTARLALLLHWLHEPRHYTDPAGNYFGVALYRSNESSETIRSAASELGRTCCLFGSMLVLIITCSLHPILLEVHMIKSLPSCVPVL